MIKNVQHVLIKTEDAGQRIDNFLRLKLKGVPFSCIYKIIRRGEVRVDKARIKPFYKIKQGDTIRIPPVIVNPSSTTKQPNKKIEQLIRSSIIYEDPSMLIINKPQGIAVHGGSGISAGIIEIIRSIRKDLFNIELVHRLDKETSGCLILAKKKSKLRYLHELIREKKICKKYLLIVEGLWPTSLQKINAPLLKYSSKSGERFVCVNQNGKPSLTKFKIIKRFKTHTILKAELITGRTHQIRVHAKHSGYPILGDKKYATDKSNALSKALKTKYLCLHACTISFINNNQEIFEISAPLPDYIKHLYQ